jgi:hypothetical protein
MAGFIAKQGSIDSGGTVMHKTAGTSIISVISLIKAYSRSDYSITLRKYDSSADDLREIYTINLTAGDQLTDETPYYLLPGDYLVIESGTEEVSYFIQGQES